MIDVEMLRPTADEMLSGLSATEAMKQRILFAADPSAKIPAVAGEMLGGLTATPALRHRILVAAEQSQRGIMPARRPSHESRPSLARLTPAIGMALVLTLMIGLGVNHANLTNLAAPYAQTDLGSGMAGEANVSQDAVPQFRSLFLGEGANPPLIGIHGRYYRMLDVYVPQDVVGTAIAEVQDFTEEPSLATPVGVVSNVVTAGTQVYAVDGISSKTACIADVGGTLRLFQRVGYASDSVIGREMFEDTLDVYNMVSAVELSGVGTITNEEYARDIIYCLYEQSNHHGNDLGGGNQAITIYLRNGLSFQLLVDGDIISGCGAWTCPEFFITFDELLAEQAKLNS